MGLNASLMIGKFPTTVPSGEPLTSDLRVAFFCGAPSLGALLEVQVLPQADHSERNDAQLHEGDRLLAIAAWLSPISMAKLASSAYSASAECYNKDKTWVALMSVRQRVWPSGQVRSKHGAQSSAGR